MSPKNLDWYKGRSSYTEIMGLSAVRRLPRVGKLHLGIKVPSAKNEKCRKGNHPNEPMCPKCSYPKDTDYFVLEKGMDPRLREKFVSVYGEAPKAIDVYFPSADRSLVFPQALMCYRGMKLWCRGDGAVASRIDESSGSMKQVECPCEHLTGVDKDGRPCTADCRFRAKLMVLLPKVTMAGIWQIDSGSSNNIIEINSALDYYQALLARIAFVPFTLKRVPTPVQTPENKIVTKALLKLEFEGDEKEVAAFRQRDAIGRLMPGVQSAVAALPPPPDSEPEPGEDDAIEVEGVRLTPPDQAVLPEAVDPETGEVSEAGAAEFPAGDDTDREIAEQPDGPDNGPTPDGPEAGDPFPGASPSPAAAPSGSLFDRQQEQPPAAAQEAGGAAGTDVTGIAAFLRGADSATVLEARWKAHVVSNKGLTGAQKAELQGVKFEVQKKFQGRKSA